MIYSLIFAAAALGPGIGASPLMATPPMMARDLSFGSCTNPRVSFSSGAFVPENLVDFPHASVTDPKPLFSFICSQLVSKCGLHKTDPAVLACVIAAPLAEALGAKAIAAKTFNAALGLTTYFSTADKSGPSSGSPGRSPRDELTHVPPPPKAAPPPVPSPSPVPPPPVPRKEDSHIHKPAPSPPHAPVPPHRHHPVSGPHSRALRDVDVDTKAKGPAPNKDEGANGVKGDTPPGKGHGGPPPPPSSSLPPPQSPPPAHGPSPLPAPGLF
ncbi:hypothetical protein BS47DRAFT_512369 [Hydnum rufescens UP504]|uniref:Uncharacterized protein n=1 Tax=Hydnum rufescens UP504 TaxID=1448309 RepID=A0A9P6DPL1_9AGAM|nr:hypothetical protein BS47DRAFT_512369 [Hydnum rufescens UP504]